MGFEQVDIGGELYFRERLTASIQTTSLDKISAISGANLEHAQKALQALADATVGAGIMRTPDAAYLQGIYVSSGFNKNDDIFLPTEMARSYGTIRLKPLDVDHVIEERESLVDCTQNNPAMTFKVGTNTITGVIYDVALVNNKSNLIVPAADAADKLGGIWSQLQAADSEFVRSPDEHFASDRYDVVMAGMLWKWLFPKTTTDLVSEINAGHRALSMEVFFRDFDWYVGGRIYKRDEAPHLESAFRNGGIGGQRVGRVLRGMLFGGGGLVRNPANPGAFDFIEIASVQGRSAAFVSTASLQLIEKASKASSEKEDHQSSISGVGTEADDESQPQGGSVMDLKELTATIDKAVADLAASRADTIVAQKETQQLKAEVASLKQVNETLTAAKAELEGKLTEASASVEKLTSEAAALKADTEKAATAATAADDQTKSEIEALKQRAEAAEAKVQVFEQADLMIKRVAALEEAGVLVDKDEDAQKSVAMSQKEFDAFVAERIKLREAIAGKCPPTKKEEDMTDEERQALKKKQQQKKGNEEGDEAKASVETDPAKKAEADVTVFPVFEGIQTANRTLAALLANDPNAKTTFSKYASI